MCRGWETEAKGRYPPPPPSLVTAYVEQPHERRKKTNPARTFSAHVDPSGPSIRQPRRPPAPEQVVKGLRLGGLKEALALVAQGKAKPEEFKVCGVCAKLVVCVCVCWLIRACLCFFFLSVVRDDRGRTHLVTMKNAGRSLCRTISPAILPLPRDDVLSTLTTHGVGVDPGVHFQTRQPMVLQSKTDIGNPQSTRRTPPPGHDPPPSDKCTVCDPPPLPPPNSSFSPGIQGGVRGSSRRRFSVGRGIWRRATWKACCRATSIRTSRATSGRTSWRGSGGQHRGSSSNFGCGLFACGWAERARKSLHVRGWRSAPGREGGGGDVRAWPVGCVVYSIFGHLGGWNKSS